MNKATIIITLLMTLVIITNAQRSINVSQGLKLHLLKNIHQNTIGQDMEIKSDVSLDIDVEVKSTTPDILLTYTIKRMQLKADGMGNSMEFDSDINEDKETIIGQILAETLDKPLEFYISSNGTQVKNKKSIPSFETAKNILGDIDEFNSEIFIALPKSIKVGEHWSDVQSKDDNNKSNIDYTVNTISNNEADLSFIGSIDKMQIKKVQGIETTNKANIKITGRLTVNLITGLIKEKRSEYISKGTTDIMGQKIPFIITTRNTNSSTN